MKRKILLILLLASMIGSVLFPAIAYAQTIVETDVGTGSSAFEFPNQRKSWYSDGRNWVWWVDQPADRVYMKSSDDRGDSWSGKTTIKQVGGTMSIEGNNVSLCFDGTNVHYVIAEHTGVGAFTLRYRMGDPDSDGTLDWAAAEQTLATGGYYNNVDIAVDSDGYPWVIYNNGNSDVFVRASTTKDGTWTNDGGAGSPWTLDTNASGTSIHALTSGRMVATFQDGGKLTARRWTGAGWGTEAQTSGNVDYYSAVSQDDDLHAVLLENTTHDIESTTYSYSSNTWSAYTTLHSGATATSAPVIQRNTENNDRIVYWENHPTDDHVYYAQYANYETTWYTDNDWINETDQIPATGYWLNCDYTFSGGTAGLYYIAGTETLKYKALDLPTAVETLEASAITPMSATLRGEILSLGSGTLVWRGFYYGTDPTLATYSAIGEVGEFGVGVFTRPLTDLDSDTLYYFKAVVTDEYDNDAEGSILGFLTDQQDYESELEEGTGNSTMIPPLTDQPTTWVTDPKDWGEFGLAGAQIPYTFLLYLLLTGLVVTVGIILTKLTKSIGILFMCLGFVIGIFSFYPRDGYLDWWVLFPFILVGIALIMKKQQLGWS